MTTSIESIEGAHEAARDGTAVRRASDVLAREEIRALTRSSDLAGAAAVLGSWAMIVGTFVALARWPHPATFLVAVVILGGRQLALAVMMHDAAHGSLFRTRFLNDVVTDLVCARPVGADVARYRKHHLGHHAHTGTERDPDLGLASAFPVSRASMARKLARDITGISGLRRLVGLVLMDAELLSYNVGGAVVSLPRRGWAVHARALLRNGGGAFAANAVLFSALAATGHAWLYAAWAVANLTTYGLFLRVRSIAEHACLDRTADPLRNTRTTRANLLARLTVAPLNVSHHLEHHLLPTVPYFRLPALGRALSERGALPAASTAPGYLAVLRSATLASAREEV
jgi:fatty acid desaturase